MSNSCPRCEAVLDDSVVRCHRCGASVEAKRAVPKKTRFQMGELIDGRYQVTEVLPSGGMGEVYKVRHIHLNDLRIIKVLRSELTNDETGKKRFLREAKLAASISHPNLACLHDFSALTDGSFYMVGEYVDGMTIADHLQAGGRFELAHVLTIAEQVLKALSALHHRGIVHRDISPDNLMLTKNAAGNTLIKVIDLGIAKSIDTSEGLTSAGFFVGKARYASPEQIRCDSEEKIDRRTDLYSLGIVLYEMITGRDPYAGSTPAEYVIKKVTQEVRRINEPGKERLVPDEVERFVLTLLKADRDERFQSADQALAEVTRLQQNFPELADQTLSTVTLTRPMTTTELPMEPPPPPQKRPITEEVDLQSFAPKEPPPPPPIEPPAPPVSVPEPPSAVEESPQSTEVIPMADFARELYAQQHGVGTGALPTNAPASPTPSALFGDEASTVVDYMPPTAPEPEPFTDAPTLANFVPPETSAPGSTDVMPMLEKESMAALRAQAAPRPVDNFQPSQDATMVTALPLRPSLLDQLPDGSIDPSLAPTNVDAQIPFDPSINPNARLSRRSSAVEASAPPARAADPLPKRSATPPPTMMAEKIPELPRPPAAGGTKSRAGLWIALAAILLTLMGVAFFAYRILAPRFLKPGVPSSAPPQAETASQAAQAAPPPEAPVVAPPPAIAAPVTTTVAPAVQTDTLSTSKSSPAEPISTQPPPPVTQTVASEPARAPDEPRKKPTPPKKKKERPVKPKPAIEEPPAPVVAQVKEGDIVESGAGVVDARIQEQAPIKLPFRARLARARGSVKLYAMVGVSGKVEQVRVLSSSGNDQVDRAGQAAAIASTFTPATKNGVRVRMWRTIEYQVGRQ